MKGNRVWRLLNIDTQKEILTTNAGFNEYTFPKFTITNGPGRSPIPQWMLIGAPKHVYRGSESTEYTRRSGKAHKSSEEMRLYPYAKD